MNLSWLIRGRARNIGMLAVSQGRVVGKVLELRWCGEIVQRTWLTNEPILCCLAKMIVAGSTPMSKYPSPWSPPLKMCSQEPKEGLCITGKKEEGGRSINISTRIKQRHVRLINLRWDYIGNFGQFGLSFSVWLPRVLRRWLFRLTGQSMTKVLAILTS